MRQAVSDESKHDMPAGVFHLDASGTTGILIFELHQCSGMGHGGQIDRILVRQPDTTMRYRFSDSVGFGRAMNSIR